VCVVCVCVFFTVYTTDRYNFRCCNHTLNVLAPLEGSMSVVVTSQMEQTVWEDIMTHKLVGKFASTGTSTSQDDSL